MFLQWNKSKDLNFKATELRLGLPGSELPKRDNSNGVKDLKIFASGAKRVFCDTINGNSETWGFGSEVNMGKDCGFINSPKGVKVGNKILGSNAVKEAAPNSPNSVQEKKAMSSSNNGHGVAPAAKAQVVGWPPIRSFRKNMVGNNPPKTEEDAKGKLLASCHYVKVSMDGAPYLRKVDLTIYNSYNDLSSALDKMFSCFKDGQCGTQGTSSSDGLNESKLVDLLHGSEYVLTYEDKDGDWMLVGDVPWKVLQKAEDHEEFRCKWSSSKSDGEVQKSLKICSTLAANYVPTSNERWKFWCLAFGYMLARTSNLD